LDHKRVPRLHGTEKQKEKKKKLKEKGCTGKKFVPTLKVVGEKSDQMKKSAYHL